jgi:hypothetical protein
MKITNSSILKIGLVISFVLTAQWGFARDIVIQKDDTPPPSPIQPNSMSLSIPVSATIDATDLTVYFDWAVGDAVVAVYDANNQVVVAQAVNTDTTLQVSLPCSGWASGNYTVRVSYGTTHLMGEFLIE